MLRKIWIWLFLIFIGLVVLAWPEENDLMLVKISESHGPSILDSIGLAIMMLGYVPMMIGVATRLSLMYSRFGKLKCNALILISVSFLIFIIVALYCSWEPLLWLSITVSTIAQTVLIYYALRTKN